MRSFLIALLILSLSVGAAMPTAQAQRSLEEVRSAIQAQGLNWVAGETSVSNLSLEEKRRLCGFRPEMEEAALAAPPLMKAPLGAFASVLDWRDNPSGFDWMTPVRNQAGCGSCVAFAVVGAFEACENINVNGAPDPTLNLSEQFLFSCGGGDCDAGWYFSGSGGALEYLKNVGVTDEACFPYQSGDGVDRPCDDRCADWASRVVTTSDYTMISYGSPPTDAELKNYVQVQPVPCAMDVYLSFYSYTGDVYERLAEDVLVGGHGVVIVGWDDTTSPPCWIVKNSWGTSWGELGYFKIKRGDSDIGSYAAFLDYDNAPPPLTYAGTFTPVGIAVLLSSFVVLVALIHRRKASIAQHSGPH